MRIAVLSDPNNFHTQKWVAALVAVGAEVTVFSFEAYQGSKLNAVQLKPPFAYGGGYSYLSYLMGGKVLALALEEHGIDVVNALNVTPFGVWARKAGRHPLIISALGADILEYPPVGEGSPLLELRSWDNVEASQTWARRFRQGLARKFYRKQVSLALAAADLVTGDNQYLVDCMQNWFEVSDQNIRLLRWGVEKELFEVAPERLKALREQFHLQPGKPVIFSPRGAKAIYQGDIIVEAFARILAGGRQDFNCIMLSAGYEISQKTAEKARKLAQENPNFTFIEEVLPRENVYALWNLVDIFISAPIYDGYSAAVAEGRYVGAIPVLNDIPANQELFDHDVNGWFCEPFTSEQLALDLQFLLKNLPERKEKYAVLNRFWIEKHSLVKENAERFLTWVAEFST
ncbi:MAG TPA: glycosyltransferase [Bacteroidetes bacterium]|nr:glycosyltransferase [Bacteroidota bacterium]